MVFLFVCLFVFVFLLHIFLNYISNAIPKVPHTVVYGHIQTGQDFFNTAVPDCDYIVSNPPYSLKSEVIKRLYEIGKPFAMLVNFQGIFDSRERFRIFKENRVEMLWLSPRVNYLTGNGELPQRAPFQSGYLCSGICESQLEFEYLDIQS